MTPKQARRSRLGMTWLALALGALALLAMPGLAAAKDRNHDRIPDRWEKRHKLSLNVNQARHDQDGDHLRNRAEFLAGDDPRDHDSDDDGVLDGEEQAGTISSFDAATGRLVIDLFGTDTVAGLVTDATEIKCEDEHSTTANASSEGSGSGEEEPGDDHGDDGVEAGDDNGGDHEAGDDNSGPSDNSGPGSENSGPGHEGDDDSDRTCTTAELVPGAVVEEAELEVRNGQAVFEEVELSGRAV
ncbi:MAG: hypothetical protein ACJ76B_08010 [Solirubrobacterales bacterium]